ncbi:MAG: hypothetical protein J7518_03080 [Nocardioidaceae bacterium]|nr:hypothetical protein [Nocardioidaceae bacterium]
MPPRSTQRFTQSFLGDVLLRAGLGLLAMLCSFGGGAVGRATDTEWGPFLGAVAGLLAGLALAFLLYRRLTRERN